MLTLHNYQVLMFIVVNFSLVNDVDLQSFIYKGYGKDLAKKHKLSPDAFTQIVFQLSYYRCMNIPLFFESILSHGLARSILLYMHKDILRTMRYWGIYIVTYFSDILTSVQNDSVRLKGIGNKFFYCFV